MARTSRSDEASRRPLRYCLVHEQAFLPQRHGRGTWIALARERLRYALRWAQAGGCAEQIQVECTACGQCRPQHEEHVA